MEVHAADPEDRPAVMTVFDGAMLETGAERVAAAIERGDLLVATEAGRVLGACLVAGREIEAVAVRPGRRGQGIGTALVEAAADERGRLVAEFDPRVRPFWASLGFEIEPVGDTDGTDGARLWGVRRSD